MDKAHFATVDSATLAFFTWAASPRSSSRFAGPTRYKAECIGGAPRNFETIVGFVTVILSRCLYHMG